MAGGSNSLPRKSMPVSSTQDAVAKVSEVSSLPGRPRTNGLGKAVEASDNLGMSMMTKLNGRSRFVSGAVIKRNEKFVPRPVRKRDEISILAFEVANTIVNGYNILQSLSQRSIRHLKEEVLLSEAVQDLVSNDMYELLGIVAADKRQELNVFSHDVVRFGNLLEDCQWHNLDHYFEKDSPNSSSGVIFTTGWELVFPRPSKDGAESIMQKLMTLVQFTAELYHELHALDRLEQDYFKEKDSFEATQRGDSLAFLRAEVKRQRKQVKHLKKKALWSRSFEKIATNH